MIKRNSDYRVFNFPETIVCHDTLIEKWKMNIQASFDILSCYKNGTKQIQMLIIDVCSSIFNGWSRTIRMLPSQGVLLRQKFQEPLEISWPGNGAKASLAIFSARTLLLRYSCEPKVAFLRSISWMTCSFVNFPTVTFASTKSSRIC